MSLIPIADRIGGMDKLPLTDTQYQVFSYLKHFITVKGYPPTKLEIADGLGYKSANSVQESLPRIAAAGHIKLIKNIARGIIVL